MLPLSRWNRPLASARYVLWASPAVNISVRRTMACRVFATTTAPLVSRSRRCAGLGLNSPSGVWTPWRARYARTWSTSVSPVMPEPGWIASPDGLSTARMCSSSYRTLKSCWMASGGLGGGGCPACSTWTVISSPGWRSCASSIHADLLRPDQLVEMAQGEALEAPAEELVQPLPGGIRADLEVEPHRGWLSENRETRQVPSCWRARTTCAPRC